VKTGDLLPEAEMLPKSSEALRRFVEKRQGDVGDTHALADAMYRAGFQDCMSAQVVMSGAIDRLEALNELQTTVTKRTGYLLLLFRALSNLEPSDDDD
jgi:hypothetical protein